jgi:hypothetical protein
MAKQISEFAKAAREMIAAYGNCGSPRQQEAANALQKCINDAEQYKAEPGLIEEARAQYADDDLEIDDDATTSPGDDGTWVSAWVWMWVRS